MIATANPRGAIWRGHQRLNLWTLQKRYGSSHIAFAWQGQDLLAMEQVGWLLQSDESEEGPDGGQPRVAAAGAVAARTFKMDEEVTNQIRAQIVKGEVRRRAAGPHDVPDHPPRRGGV